MPWFHLLPCVVGESDWWDSCSPVVSGRGAEILTCSVPSPSRGLPPVGFQLWNPFPECSLLLVAYCMAHEEK